MVWDLRRRLGRLLRDVHAGERKIAWYSSALIRAPDTIIVTSPLFVHAQPMPGSCAALPDGPNVSPSLRFRGAPPGTRELVLIVQDPDAPLPRPVVHAIVTGIPPERIDLDEGAIGPAMTPPLTPGAISFGKIGYMGPAPPHGHGVHRYVFQIVASDTPLDFAGPPSLRMLLKALDGHVLARGQLVGIYERL